MYAEYRPESLFLVLRHDTSVQPLRLGADLGLQEEATANMSVLRLSSAVLTSVEMKTAKGNGVKSVTHAMWHLGTCASLWFNTLVRPFFAPSRRQTVCFNRVLPCA